MDILKTLGMLLAMAGSEVHIEQLVASEAIIAATAKKKDAQSIITQGMDILKTLYKSKNDHIKVRALVGMCSHLDVVVLTFIQGLQDVHALGDDALSILLLGRGGNDRLTGNQLLDVHLRTCHGKQHPQEALFGQLAVAQLWGVLEQGGDPHSDSHLRLEALISEHSHCELLNLFDDLVSSVIIPHLLIAAATSHSNNGIG